MVYYTDENGNAVLSGTRMSIAAFWCSVGSVICYLLCYFMVTERVKAETTKQKFSFMGLIGSLIQNRALIGIVVSALLLLLSQLSLSNMGAYIYPNYFGDVKGLSLASLIEQRSRWCCLPLRCGWLSGSGKGKCRRPDRLSVRRH